MITPANVAEILGCSPTEVTVISEGDKVVEIKTPQPLTAEQEKQLLRHTDPEAWRQQVLEDLLDRLENATSINDVKAAAATVKSTAGLARKYGSRTKLKRDARSSK